MHLVTKTRQKKQSVARASFFFHLAFLGGFFTAFCFQNGTGIGRYTQRTTMAEKMKNSANNNVCVFMVICLAQNFLDTNLVFLRLSSTLALQYRVTLFEHWIAILFGLQPSIFSSSNNGPYHLILNVYLIQYMIEEEN